MKMTDEKVKAINNKFCDLLNEVKRPERRLGIAVTSAYNPEIKRNSMIFCQVDELTAIIEELTILRDAVREETGIEF